jgi:hypothetical protein
MSCLADAYRLCFGHPQACPVYRDLARGGDHPCDACDLEAVGAA